MYRPDLENLLSHELPSGFHFAWYQPGNEAWWADIQHQCEGYAIETALQLFHREFANGALLAKRQCYILKADGAAIGTITGWIDDPDDSHSRDSMGRIHWVAIVPEFQGRGLAKPLLSTALNRLRNLGHRDCYLVTDSFRPRAVQLYRNFGFVPMLVTEADRAAWEAVPEEIRGLFE